MFNGGQSLPFTFTPIYPFLSRAFGRLSVLSGGGADFQNKYISDLPIHTNLGLDRKIRDEARLYKLLHGMKFFCSVIYTFILQYITVLIFLFHPAFILLVPFYSIHQSKVFLCCCFLLLVFTKFSVPLHSPQM